jgi:hypothetical protein
VFTARYALSPYIKQIRFVFKGLINKEVCDCKDQHPVAPQQNIAIHFSLVWDEPISQHCTGDMLGEKNMWENLARGNITVEGINMKNWRKH